MTKATENPFDDLLGELDVLAKAMKSDDTTAAAAADAGVQDTGGEGDGGDGVGEGDGDGDDVLGKSFKVQLEDGTTADAFDATAMLKAMGLRIDGVGSQLMKGMTAITSLVKAQGDTIKSQGALIKSLQGELSKIGGQGRGRQATVAVVGTTANTDGGGKAAMTKDEILTKALALSGKGLMTSLDVSRVQSHLNNGLALPADLATAISAAA